MPLLFGRPGAVPVRLYCQKDHAVNGDGQVGASHAAARDPELRVPREALRVLERCSARSRTCRGWGACRSPPRPRRATRSPSRCRSMPCTSSCPRSRARGKIARLERAHHPEEEGRLRRGIGVAVEEVVRGADDPGALHGRPVRGELRVREGRPLGGLRDREGAPARLDLRPVHGAVVDRDVDPLERGAGRAGVSPAATCQRAPPALRRSSRRAAGRRGERGARRPPTPRPTRGAATRAATTAFYRCRTLGAAQGPLETRCSPLSWTSLERLRRGCSMYPNRDTVLAKPIGSGFPGIVMDRVSLVRCAAVRRASSRNSYGMADLSVADDGA